MSILELLLRYREGLLSGLLVTLRLCAIVWIVGLAVGTLVGAAAHRWPRLVGWPSRVGSFFLSSVPVLVFLFWLHYPAQSLLGVRVDGFYTAAVALGIVNTFAVGEAIRRSLNSFPLGYLDAARVSGMPPASIVWRIQLPIVARDVAPPLLTLQVGMLQATLFASLISVDELFRVAQRINAEVYQPVAVYSLLAVVFLLICLPLNGAAVMLQRRLARRMRGV